MIAGAKRWMAVTTDSAGVPHGGRYGDVAWFEPRLKRVGLKLAWSRLWHCFLIYMERGPGKFICQMQCYNHRHKKPIPLTANLLWLLVYAWERHCRTPAKTIVQALGAIQRKRKEAVAKEIYERAELTREDRANEIWRFLGRETRPLISIPKVVRAANG